MAGRPLAPSTSSESRRKSKKNAILFSGRSGSPFIFGQRFSLNLAPPRLWTPRRAQGRRPLQPSSWASIAGFSATTRRIGTGYRACCSGYVWRWRLAKSERRLSTTISSAMFKGICTDPRKAQVSVYPRPLATVGRPLATVAMMTVRTTGDGHVERGCRLSGSPVASSSEEGHCNRSLVQF